MTEKEPNVPPDLQKGVQLANKLRTDGVIDEPEANFVRLTILRWARLLYPGDVTIPRYMKSLCSRVGKALEPRIKSETQAGMDILTMAEYLEPMLDLTRTSGSPDGWDISGNNVFVVHGHDAELLDEAKTFLEDYSLNPVILHLEPDRSQTVIRKFEHHATTAHFAFVLLTPDDLGVGKKDIIAGKTALEKRARQNVILELGYFIGRLHRENVCCINKGDVALPSDLFGVLEIRVAESLKDVEEKLVRELKDAGLEMSRKDDEEKTP